MDTTTNLEAALDQLARDAQDNTEYPFVPDAATLDLIEIARRAPAGCWEIERTHALRLLGLGRFA